MRYFCINDIPFPRRRWRQKQIGTLYWGPANLSRITTLLHNPTYTGTYVYGRRRCVNVIEDGQIKKVKTQTLPQDEWKVVIHNTHEAYISWEEYLSNCERLRQNSPGHAP
ncbi:MAG: recombinase family protein [Cyanobacteria bacterium J06632_19]